MDREGKCRTEDKMTKDKMEAIRLEIGGVGLVLGSPQPLGGSPQPLGGSLSPKNPSQQWIDGHCNAVYHGNKGSLQTKGG